MRSGEWCNSILQKVKAVHYFSAVNGTHYTIKISVSAQKLIRLYRQLQRSLRLKTFSMIMFQTFASLGELEEISKLFVSETNLIKS